MTANICPIEAEHSCIEALRYQKMLWTIIYRQVKIVYVIVLIVLILLGLGSL